MTAGNRLNRTNCGSKLTQSEDAPAADKVREDLRRRDDNGPTSLTKDFWDQQLRGPVGGVFDLQVFATTLSGRQVEPKRLWRSQLAGNLTRETALAVG